MEIHANRTYSNRFGEQRLVTEIKELDFIGDHELYVKYQVTKAHDWTNLYNGGKGTMRITSFRKWAKKEVATEATTSQV